MEQPIRTTLDADLKDAMRAGDKVTRDAIRYILAALKNAEIEARVGSGSLDEVATLRKLAKQLDDSIDQYKVAGRDDLVEKEAAQREVLQRYVPSGMTDEALAAVAAEIVGETGARGPQDMGKIMPALLARVGDQAEGRRVSAAAKEALSRAAS